MDTLVDIELAHTGVIKAFCSEADGDDKEEVDGSARRREIGKVAAHVDDGAINIAGEDKLQS